MCHRTEKLPENRDSVIIIRNYGLLEPLDWDRDCDEELNLMDDLWNKLVDINEKYIGLYHKTISLDQLFSAAKEEYYNLFKSGAPFLSVSEAKKNLAVAQKDASRRMAAELRALETERRDEVKLARQNSGLWWGNYNALVRAFENGRSAAVRGGHTMRRRTAGGNGRLTNTLQGGAAVEHLFDGSLSQVMIREPPERAWSAESRGERRRLQRTVLTATVFVRLGERRNVTWPMVMHRPIPSDCRVKNIVITRRRIGDRWKWAASFTCTRRADQLPPTPSGSELIAVDVGWRRVPEGLRVATVLAAGASPRFVILPPDLIESFAFIDELRQRVRTSARTGLELLHNINSDSFEQPYQDLLDKFQSRQEEGLAHLKQFCYSEFFTKQSREAIGTKINSWRLDHIRLARWLSNQQRKLVARRNNIYQNAVIGIVENARKLIVNDVKFGEIAARGRPSKDAKFFPRRANYYRVVAAPSELIRCLKFQAFKRSVAFEKREAINPVGCPECGSATRRTRADAWPQICARCGISFDQDIAVCESLLLPEM